VPGGTQFADGAGQIIRSGHHSTLRRLSEYGTVAGRVGKNKAEQSRGLPGLAEVSCATSSW
jgi:hypothetical protein